MKTETLILRFSQGVPNNPKLPALIYRSAFEPTDCLADLLEKRFQENGWRGCWRWGVYEFHHFHSNAHEVLGVASGEARLTLGGPEGETVHVRAGDMILLPAGTGHKNEGSSPDFQVVGAYPEGQEDCDLIRAGEGDDEEVTQSIRGTSIPESDPAFGPDGPLGQHWKDQG